MIGGLVAWCAVLTVLQLREPIADGAAGSEVQELSEASAELTAWQDDADRTFTVVLDRLTSLDRLHAQAQARLDAIEDQAQEAADTAGQQDDDIQAVSALLATVGQRLDSADDEMQQLNSTLFGFQPPTFESDIVGDLQACVNGNFAALLSELGDYGLGYLYLDSC